MGSDSAYSDDTIVHTAGSKLFKLDNNDVKFICGASGKASLTQPVMYFTPPTTEGEYDLEYMVRKFIPSLREYLTELSLIQASEESEIWMLIGVQGHLFEVSTGFVVLEPAPFYSAIGSGGVLGLGALYVATESECDPEASILYALEAACLYDQFVRKPLHVEHV